MAKDYGVRSPVKMSDPHAPPALSEPHTPMWLPGLGAFLFLLAGIWWATQPKPVIETDSAADAGAAESAAPAAGGAVPAPTMPMGHGLPGR